MDKGLHAHLSDQGSTGARIEATLVATFYHELVDSRVPPDHALMMTLKWMTNLRWSVTAQTVVDTVIETLRRAMDDE